MTSFSDECRRWRSPEYQWRVLKAVAWHSVSEHTSPRGPEQQSQVARQAGLDGDDGRLLAHLASCTGMLVGQGRLERIEHRPGHPEDDEYRLTAAGWRHLFDALP